MKTTLPVLLALTSKVFASPVESLSVELHSRGVRFTGEENMLEDSAIDSIAVMEFVGPVTPGGPDVTLRGSSKDIYEQILELNPDYDVFAFPSYAEKLEAQGITKENIDNPLSISINPTLSARDALEKRASFNCNIGSWVANVHTQCTEGLIYLRRLGGAQCYANGNACARVSCSNNCGMYLCNKTSRRLGVTCEHIANDMQDIVGECGREVSDWILEGRGRMHFNDHNTELSSPRC